MTKTFVLDTNVLLSDYEAMFKFEENTVHIPLVVLEELDNFKKDSGELGFNARQTSRYLDKLCKRGDISQGVPLNNGGKLFVSDGGLFHHPNTKVDDIIISYAKNLQNSSSEQSVIVVSKDVNVRLKARIQGLIAQDHEPKELRNLDTHYSGNSEMEINHEESERLRDTKALSLEGKKHSLTDNEYVLLRTDSGHGSRLSRYTKTANQLQLVNEFREGIAGIKGKNKEQRYAIDALMDPNIKLVTILGKAGTGKTLLAVAAGLKMVIGGEEPIYTKVIVARPVIPLGKDIGYLPGDINEKLAPWMQPIYDNIDFILENSKTLGGFLSAGMLVDKGVLRIEPLTYIRGRSIPNQFIIIDEAQNLTPHEMKAIITRAGEGTKIVLTGDIEQIDAAHLDSINNGLTYVINKFRDQKISAHITLTKGERSELAELASNLL